jgi:hypothetical protein
MMVESTLLRKARRIIVKGCHFFYVIQALFMIAVPAAKAEDDASASRPVVTASFSGYAEFKLDLEYLATLSGNLEMAARVERMLLPFTEGQGPPGIDLQRP